MDYTICYLEVFDEEINQWEYSAESQNPEPVNCWFNNLDSFFEEFNLTYLFREIENNELPILFDKYKGLPTDCDNSIVNAYHFYFEAVSMCQNASYINLCELSKFDYNKTINL